MAEDTQMGFENTVYNTQTTEVAEIHFLKPSCLINVHGRISIASLDHISQILIDTFTLFRVDGSTNLFFIFGEHGKSNAALITATTSSSFRNLAVKKHGDSDSGSTGNSPDQDANNNNNNTNVNNDAVVAPFVYAEYGETSGVNRDDSDGDDDEWVGGGEGDEIIELDPVRVHRIEVSIDGSKSYKAILNTDLIAWQYNSWQHFAAAIYHVWLEINGLSHDSAPAISDMTRFNCWPGAITTFGRYEQQEFLHFNWDRDEWDDVSMLITDVRVVTYLFLQYEDGSNNNNNNNGSRQQGNNAQTSNGDAQHDAAGNGGIANHKDLLIICVIGVAVFFFAMFGVLVVFALTLLSTR